MAELLPPEPEKETPTAIELSFATGALIKAISEASTDKPQILKTLKEKAAALPEAAGLLNRITAAPSLQ